MADAHLVKIDVTKAPPQQTSNAPAVSTLQRMTQIEANTWWPTLSQLRMTMAASLELNGFKIKDLLRLEEGQFVESAWPETEDVPLYVGQVQVAWGEFEVVEQRLVVRLTRLA